MKTYNSLKQVQHDLKAGEVTCETLVKFYLGRIEDNSDLNAFLEVYAEEAVEAARNCDQQIANGEWKPLTGAVIGIKDVLSYKGHKISASSRILENFETIYTATAVQRLVDAGAIIIGRLNCDEFAMGSSNENSAFGPTLNAVDKTRVPGGSSGGSAVAVQANLCLASLGTDTGGSIRQPASLCGIIGLKPTYGRISRYGLFAYASSFDQIGTFTRSVEDAGLLLSVMAGRDEYDATSSSEAVDNYLELESDKKYSFAYYSEAVESDRLDPEIKQHFLNTIEALKAAGHTVKEAHFPLLKYLVPTYYILTTAEASSNLSRYDGVHYGYRSKQVEEMNDVYVNTRSEAFGPEVKRRIMLGTFVLSAGYYDAYYSKAQKVRKQLYDQTNELLKEHDFILSPTTPEPAFKIGEKTDDPVTMYLSDIYTVQANLVGIPSISLPTGKHSSGLPFGIQLLAPKFAEKKLLAASQMMLQNNSNLVTV